MMSSFLGKVWLLLLIGLLPDGGYARCLPSMLDGKYVGATGMPDHPRGRPLSDRQGRVFVSRRYTANNLQSSTFPAIHNPGNESDVQASLSGRERAATRGRPYISPIQHQITIRPFTFRRGLMGTTFTVTLYAPDSLTAQRTYETVSARMDTLNLIMSDYLDGSELNRLSATSGQNRWVRVSPTLFDVLQKAKLIAQQSGGRYDPTIGPLSQLWRRAVRQRQFPDARERRKARKAVSWRYIELDSSSQSVRLRKPGMRLDLGGIGQGFAIDEAQKVLYQHGIRVFLLDIGGDILVGDAPPTQPEGWRIGLPKAEADSVIFLKNAAITTSGDTERHLDINGRRYSHIMNPRTGLGLRHFVQATVHAPTGTYADALTKVFSVATPNQRKRLQRRFPQARVWIKEKKNGNTDLRDLK
jgi:FAD:protein FMN transferase